ncbi:unnamed protein product [Amoebophrya sp. A25]|nr:unnamed protein product [Amoebophrya sp. A25]|eukprot:GSA25T00021348001.1
MANLGQGGLPAAGAPPAPGGAAGQPQPPPPPVGGGAQGGLGIVAAAAPQQPINIQLQVNDLAQQMVRAQDTRAMGTAAEVMAHGVCVGQITEISMQPDLELCRKVNKELFKKQLHLATKGGIEERSCNSIYKFLYALAFNGENGSVLNFAESNQLVLMVKSAELSDQDKMRIFTQTLLSSASEVEPNPLAPTDVAAYRLRMEAWFTGAFPLLWRHAADAQSTLSKALDANNKRLEELQNEVNEWKASSLKWGGPYNNNNFYHNNNRGGGKGQRNDKNNDKPKGKGKKGGKGGKDKGKGKAKLPNACFDWMWGFCEKENCPHEHKKPSKDQFEAMQASKMAWAVQGLDYDSIPDS